MFMQFGLDAWHGQEVTTMGAVPLQLYDPDGWSGEAVTVEPIKDQLEQLLSDFFAYRERSQRPLKRRSIQEYRTTWDRWQRFCASRSMRPRGIADAFHGDLIEAFLEEQYQAALANGGGNAGRLCNKRREHLHAICTWAAKPNVRRLGSIPIFPDKRPQRTAAGNFYFSDAEIDRLYWAARLVPAPKHWPDGKDFPHYLRTALVLFWNLGLDTQSLWPYDQPEFVILRRHIFLDRELCPSRQYKLESPYGWIYVYREKTGKSYERPLNRSMAEHVRRIMDDGDPDSPLMNCFGCRSATYRPNSRIFRPWCDYARLEPPIDPATGRERSLTVKYLRKTAGAAKEIAAENAAQGLLGHSDARTTETNYVSAELRTCVRILHQPQPASFRSVFDNTIRPPEQIPCDGVCGISPGD